jgi:hypothetical protein
VIIEDEAGNRVLDGKMTFTFSDNFKDPISIAQAMVWLNNSIAYLIPDFGKIAEKDLGAVVMRFLSI